MRVSSQMMILLALILSGCDSGSGVPSFEECSTDSDCDGGYCEASSGQCVLCVEDSQCPSGRVCHSANHTCVACQNNDHCAKGVCRSEEGVCVECLDDADCSSGQCDEALNVCVSCGSSDDCDDRSPCTLDVCEAGTCVNTPLKTAAVCSDGDPCTAGDYCLEGACRPGQPVDGCEPGPCLGQPDGTTCNDEDHCTLDDFCLHGECSSTSVDPACSQVDADSDGYTVLDGDCNDRAKEVNPGAPELCNGQDDNCDGVEDEACPASCTETDECDDGFLCWKTPGECDGEGMCEPVPSVCPAEPATPLCSCDGVTYQSECLMKQAMRSALHLGPCEGECSIDDDCDDNSECTIDQCLGEKCYHVPKDNCPPECMLSDDCFDGNECTLDSCVDNKCQYLAKPNCPAQCIVNGDCNDFNECTVDKCLETGKCLNDPLVNCPPECSDSVDCNDDDECTIDKCNTIGKCEHYPVLNCPPECVNEIDCEDGDECTKNICVQGLCKHYDVPNCPPECISSCDCYDLYGLSFPTVCNADCVECGAFWVCGQGKCLTMCGVIPQTSLSCYCLDYEICGNNWDDNCDGIVEEGCCLGFGPHTGVSSELKCCPGLTKVGDCYEAPMCDVQDPDCTQWGCYCSPCADCFQCLPCGDGVCSPGENRCNCPADCMGAGQCLKDEHCNDGNPCTFDLCDTYNMVCIFSPVSECGGQPCGTGQLCPAGTFCQFAPGSCGEAGSPGVCVNSQQVCAGSSPAPVCGCDGKTYDSVCAIAQAKQSIAYEGPCQPIQCPVLTEGSLGVCGVFLGYAWDGTKCGSISGCFCQPYCSSVFASQAECELSCH